MATIAELRSAGFTDDEIGVHIQEQSQVLSNAGFSVPEIEEHFGIQEQKPLTQADLAGKSIAEIAQIEQQRESLRVPLPVQLGFEEAPVTRQKELEAERKQVAAEGRTLFEEAKVSLKKGGLNVVAGLGGTLEELARLADKPILNQLGDVGAEFALSARFDLQDPKLTATDTKGKTPAQKTGLFIARVVPETLSFMVGTVAATVIGGPVAGAAFAFSVEGENAFQDALAGGATREEANIDRLIVGTINAALEQMQVNRVLKFGENGLQAVAKVARDRTFASIKAAGKEVSLAGLKQFITEGLQEATQEFVSIATPAVREGELPDIDQALKHIGEAGLAGGTAGLLLGGGASGVNVLATSLDSKTQLADLAEQQEDIVKPVEKQIEEPTDVQITEPTQPTVSETPPAPTVTPPKPAQAKPEAVEGEVPLEAAFKLKDGGIIKTGQLHILPKEFELSDLDATGFVRLDTNEFLTRAQTAELTGGKKTAEEIFAKPTISAAVIEPEKVVAPVSKQPEGVIKKISAKAEPVKPVPATKIVSPPPEQTSTTKTPKIQTKIAETVEEDFTQATSARQESLAEDRKSLGLDEINSKDRKSWEESLRQAKKEKIASKANRIAEEVNANPRALSDVETAGVTIRLAELKNEHKQAMEEVGKSKDDADIKTQSAEIERIEAEFDALSRAVDTSGTEKGRALAAQKLTINKDFSLISVLNRAKAAAGKKLSQIQQKAFTVLTKRLDVATKKAETLEQEVTELKAKGTLQRGARRFTALKPQQRTKTIADLASDINVLLQQGCNN